MKTEWRRADGRQLPDGAKDNGSQLVIENVSNDAAGLYECLVYDQRTRQPTTHLIAQLVVLAGPRKFEDDDADEDDEDDEDDAVDNVMQTKWVNWNASRSGIPENAFVGGSDVDRANLYIIRAKTEWGILPGNFKSFQANGLVPYHHKAHAVSDFEVMIKKQWLLFSSEQTVIVPINNCSN
jgi:Protein of unknown function (DUF3421)